MKKICFFGSDYPPTGGGISTYAVEWFSSVSKSNEVSKINAYIFRNKNPRIEVVNNKLTVTTKRTSNFFAVGIEVFCLLFKNRNAGVLHALYIFPVGFWVVFWSKFFGIPTIVTIYGTDVCSLEGRKFTRTLKRWTILNASKVIAISEFTKEATIRLFSLSEFSKNITVIYNTVPEVKTDKTELEVSSAVLEIKKKFSIDENSFVALSVCRLVPRKGLNYLIQAISRISDTNVKLLIVGDGPEKQNLQEEIKRSQLENRVFLLGKVLDLVPLYKLSNISVLPSFGRIEEGDFEGLGLVLLEAQSFGLPVIGTNTGGIPEAFNPTVTGILVPEKDIVALSEAVETLHRNMTLYDTMSSATGGFLKERFGLEKMLREYIALLNLL